MSAEETKYWIGLNLVKGIGAARMKALLDYFDSAEAAWRASAQALGEAGLSERVVAALLALRSTDALEIVWEDLQSHSIQVLTWNDARYPRRLCEIDQPPPVLYLRGELTSADRWAVAVVGTRRLSHYGRQVTEEIARGLAQNGITVVSGLARGVDGIAHQTALSQAGRTIAVLGCGLDQIYPPEHRKLAEQIVARTSSGAQGALVSDYPPGTPPEAANFPPRNRIISGLSQAVIVVEAGEKSGALITAAFAADQGREVFAVPGSIYAPQSAGANRLIQAGARIFLSLQDLLVSLDVAGAGTAHFQAASAVLPSDATEARLFALLGREPVHIDEIRKQSELPIEQVSASLTLMELKGMVRQVGNMRYVAVL